MIPMPRPFTILSKATRMYTENPGAGYFSQPVSQLNGAEKLVRQDSITSQTALRHVWRVIPNGLQTGYNNSVYVRINPSQNIVPQVNLTSLPSKFHPVVNTRITSHFSLPPTVHFTGKNYMFDEEKKGFIAPGQWVIPIVCTTTIWDRWPRLEHLQKCSLGCLWITCSGGSFAGLNRFASVVVHSHVQGVPRECGC